MSTLVDRCPRPTAWSHTIASWAYRALFALMAPLTDQSSADEATSKVSGRCLTVIQRKDVKLPPRINVYSPRRCRDHLRRPRPRRVWAIWAIWTASTCTSVFTSEPLWTSEPDRIWYLALLISRPTRRGRQSAPCVGVSREVSSSFRPDQCRSRHLTELARLNDLQMRCCCDTRYFSVSMTLQPDYALLVPSQWRNFTKAQTGPPRGAGRAALPGPL